MSLSPGQEALIADRLRIWEVRRACQVATVAATEGRSSGEAQKGDAALGALLRCLLYELSGDIAAVTLLDDCTQYFLNVVPRSALHNPHVTEDTQKWYGCQSISHHGGLCVRTITMQGDPTSEPVFEIFDLTDGHTRLLPVVDGTAASFRHYSGVPICIHGGLRIGTLFVFKDQIAQQGLSRAHRHFLHETARQIVDQIYLSVEALESKRALRCNAAVMSLLDICETSGRVDSLPQEKTSNTQDSGSHIYQHAARLLSHAFEFEGVVIQELPWSRSDASSLQPQRERLLAQHSKSEEPAPAQLSDFVSEQLLEAFPSGAVCHLLGEADACCTFAASLPGKAEFSTQIILERFGLKVTPEQFIFLPLRNTYHNRDTGFILGWSTEPTRVYASTTDLVSLSSFGVTIMSQIRRFEEQVLSRKKNDFLGSVSHEMRSPLHGVLACIDLAREAESRAQQLELLDSASSCALQLGDNIDNILQYSNIGSPSASRRQHKQLRIPNREVGHVQGSPQAAVVIMKSPDIATDMTMVLEDICSKERSKTKSMTPSVERRADSLSTLNPTWQTVVIVDSTPLSIFSLIPQSDIGVIVSNLLSNCLKFTGPSGLIRVSLDADEANVRLLFADSACGMSPDFVRHSMFVPFAQQDPLDPGMGLGLSLVHNAVERLGGHISFHTDEAEGTDFTVSIPRAQFPQTGQQQADSDSQNLPENAVDFSAFNVQLLPPGRWKGNGGDHVRNRRCLDAFVTSLRRTLSQWCLVDLRLVAEPWTDIDPKPDILFLLHSDFNMLRTEATFDDAEKVIFCPDQLTETHVHASVPGVYTTVVGPVVPWKIISALERCSQRCRSRTNLPTEMTSTGDAWSKTAIEAPRDFEEATTHAGADLNQEAKVSSQTPPPPWSESLPTRSSTASPQREPKLLLVDDNAINLRVLGMFAKKCSRIPAVSAGGGRAAIEEFKAARESKHPDATTFDIILLDLSMPDVSGFDVAAAVRELELQSQDFPRTYIAALTGLVSDKDRDAAYAAGVDEYVTKPAALKDLQQVVENWRTSRGLT